MKPEMPFTVEQWRAMSREQQREWLFDPSNSEFFDWLANEVLDPLLLTGHSEHTGNLTVAKEIDDWFAPMWQHCWVRNGSAAHDLNPNDSQPEPVVPDPAPTGPPRPLCSICFVRPRVGNSQRCSYCGTSDYRKRPQ